MFSASDGFNGVLGAFICTRCRNGGGTHFLPRNGI